MEFQREKNESGSNEDADLPWGDYQGEIHTDTDILHCGGVGKGEDPHVSPLEIPLAHA